ncbi:DUF2442 domain-containing protein [Phyllobacterium zundukense]|uniref:DUF2442 domain-containing protein n=1 Tax=Phyllobacterium zundukense TaxID=1867719 RepID=A0A2N9W1W3_9HYPH|nr:DUF2442 domain-containing protein [Phyllobacterium zundukense]ATU91499.1 hypothetical protein BLM14_07530 [Phyllobacterium zundukense]PIO45731.1 hypothetical protein B5P45_07005 [Phyllobacterium zundukense]
MASLTDVQFDLAETKGQELLLTGPRASHGHLDPVTRRVVIDLVNGCSYAFPVQFVQDLKDATEENLADIHVDGVGFNLHWPKLEVDLYVPALVAGIFGTRAWMTSELARIAGKVSSPAKSAAARANGAKGGRPRKAASG